MTAEEIQLFRHRLQSDEEYREARRAFHEAYEWLEGYWRTNRQVGTFGSFCDRFGAYFWNSVPEVRGLAGRLACEGFVGDSMRNFRPNDRVIRATMFLLYKADFVSQDALANCEGNMRRRNPDLCRPEIAECWTGDAFEAMMEIVRQIRNNLFHGRKMEFDGEQYDRNRRLIILARDITQTLLDNLVEADISLL
jgi:hypothetical protein